MTYVHAPTRFTPSGKPIRTSWHIAKLHTRAINGWKAYCGRYFDTTDVMEETPTSATCETCYRYEAKARERLTAESAGATVSQLDAVSEDDPTVGQVDPT